MITPTQEQLDGWAWLKHVTEDDLLRFDRKWVAAPRPDFLEFKDGNCELWIAGASKGGQANHSKLPYGSFWISAAKTTVRAHIFSALTRGTFEMMEHRPGLHIDHRCRRTLCVAPWHLEPATPEENYVRSRRAA